MSKKDRYIALGCSALFTLAVFLFLGFKYAYHIHYQEQFQLFQFTCAYFVDVSGVPGGFADWCGRFLTQFFYFARAGAAIVALLLVSIQMLTFSCTGRKSLLAYALSFIPAILLFLFFLDENAIPGALVSVLLCLIASKEVSAVNSELKRVAVLLAGIPLMYFLCGPAAVIYALTGVRKEKFPVWIASVLLIAVCPFTGQYIFAFPLDRLLEGIHYYRFPLMAPLWFWAGVAALLAVCMSGFTPFPSSRADRVSGLAALALIAAVTVIAVGKVSDPVKEEIMHYDFMVRHRMWNRIMISSDMKNPSAPMSVSCLNLALCQSGRMNNGMFEYFQNGPEGLLPDFVRDFTSPLPTAEAYWYLGMVNTSQRFFFEAQEAIPDFQKSARIYKRLAECNIVNRDYAVAGKYLEVLENTLFYRKWARDVSRVLADSTATAAFPEYERMRELRFKRHDFMFSDREMDSMLGLLFLENRENTAAFEYLLSWNLLKKDLDRFMDCYSLANFIIAPKHYQEAVLLHWVGTHKDFSGIPGNIDRNTVSRMSSFIGAMKNGKGEEYMKKNFGDTYWFYYYYRYNR